MNINSETQSNPTLKGRLLNLEVLLHIILEVNKEAEDKVRVE